MAQFCCSEDKSSDLSYLWNGVTNKSAGLMQKETLQKTNQYGAYFELSIAV